MPDEETEQTFEVNSLLATLRQEFDRLTAHSAQLREQNTRLAEQNALLQTRNAELERANRELHELALTDDITGISNYRGFREQMEVTFQRVRRYGVSLSLILMDVDRFKAFNDAYGHPAGDVRLRQIALLLRQQVRIYDFVARYGGEEFVLILPDTDANGAVMQAERLRHLVSQARFGNEPVTASFGAASFGPEVCSSEQMIEQADIAMYAAKIAGRNGVRHYNALSPEEKSRPAPSRPSPSTS